MSFQEFVKLVKSYEAEMKYGATYTKKIEEYVKYHPEQLNNIRERMRIDPLFGNRLSRIINTHQYYQSFKKLEDKGRIR